MIACVLLLLALPSLSMAQQQDAPTAASFDYRLWTSNAGTSIKAKLIGVDANDATLAKEDGTVIKVKLDKLSIADQAYCHWITTLAKPRQVAADKDGLQIEDNFISRLETSFIATQEQLDSVAASDLTTAAKFIAWDKAISEMVSEFLASSKSTALITATVLDAQESSDGYLINAQIDGHQNIIELLVRGRPKELVSLKAGESIQFHASLKPSSKLKLTAKLTLPWAQKQTDQQFYRQYKQLANMVSSEGLVVPLHVSMFTVADSGELAPNESLIPAID